MKRSTMVGHIAEALLNAPHLFGGDKDEREAVREHTKMARLKLAHHALKEAEDKGMVPPSFEPAVIQDEDGIPTVYAQMWQPEDH